ncbi:hypothetical protein WMY93_011724 [Mugilogobius chulae]|uniref:TIR domain-containing protein n=1 Tax=Mugilogobius chulae TaxID=88201 RepID=A0AAW0P9H5_9GOBI
MNSEGAEVKTKPPGPREETRSRPNLQGPEKRRGRDQTSRTQRRDEVKTKPPGPREERRSRPNLQGPEKKRGRDQTSRPREEKRRGRDQTSRAQRRDEVKTKTSKAQRRDEVETKPPGPMSQSPAATADHSSWGRGDSQTFPFLQYGSKYWLLLFVCYLCDDREMALIIPELSEEESYHVFCSYSSTDSQWTQELIQQLEDSGLTVCDHVRDFMIGRPIVDNMSESIHQSQKVLLVLSAELSAEEAIVPVLLQRDLPIPLHLAHLTYLDVQLPDFRQQLLRLLCSTNQEMQGSSVVPYQSPSLYNGKSLQPLSAVNEELLVNKFDCGEWSNGVPDQLSLIIRQPERYREALGIINTVSQKKVRKNERRRVLRELHKAIGQANSLLCEEHVLVGSQDQSKLLLVYVSVEGCRQELCAQSEDQDLFHTVILQYSCGYACCLVKRYFPFPTSSTQTHLENNVCFCQYVSHQRSLPKTRWFDRFIK